MDGVKQAAELIAESKYTVVLSGAGISTGSGLPDFRSGKTGLWEKFDPNHYASLTAFRHNPLQFYDWLYSFLKDFSASEPNPAHSALAQMEEAGLLNMIITQNVDGLHQASGSKNVIEVHGSIKAFTCVGCYKKFGSQYDHYQTLIERKLIPSCSECGQIMKPDVILFGEQMPNKPWRAAEQASMEADLFIVVGSSLEVMPVAALPAKSGLNGAKLMVLNIEPTYIDEKAAVVINESVENILPAILREIEYVR